MSKKLPEGWKEYKLSDIGKIHTGNTPPTKNEEFYNSNDVMFVKPDDFIEGKINIINTSKAHLSNTGAEKGRFIPKGSLLVTCIGILGKVGIIEKDCCFNQQINAIVPNKDIVIPKYIAYYILKNRHLLESIAGGAVVPMINKTQFSNIKIYLPPLEEQERIVSILERAESAICKRGECNRLLDEYLKSVFVEMFGDPVTNHKGWDKKKLKDFGKVVTGNTPSRKQEEYYGDYIEWIKSDNINTPYHYLTKAEEYLSEEGFNVGRKVPKGSILITCIAGSRSCIGNCAIANREVTFNQQINAIVPNEDVNNNFLYAQLLVGKSVVQSYSTNSMKGMISKGVFENIEFMCPPTELQNKFGEIFDKINEMKNKCEEELLGLNNLFSSLMQRAFKGEL